jgi:type IV secretory pathway ATPase VirB11/archaellum biosynthesis ATPase
MMNDKILQNYQVEVLELFKTHYKKMSAKELNLEFKTVLLSVLSELGISQSNESEILYLKDWFHNIHHQLFLKNILHYKNLNEIIFHSNDRVQLLFHNKKENIGIFNLSLDDFQLSFEIFAMRYNISWNFSDPFASFSCSLDQNDYRVTLIHHSTTANRKSKIFIRCMQQTNPTLDLFDEEEKLKDYLKGLIKDKRNILVSGSTGSGKTTILRALLNEIPPEEHVVVLEDTYEIMPFSKNQTTLLSQADQFKKSLKEYCAYALRMSPDRLIVGEMRSTEVVPFMLAMNTGHTGLMSTIHANSGVDALSRIALLFSLYSNNGDIDFNLILKLACRNIHYVVHMENKKIKEICRVIGSDGETPFFEKIYERELTC